jgi:3-oxoacid CoA-transferase B subunit
MSFHRQLSPEDEIILKRAAREVRDSWTVNLGIGLPSLLPVYLPQNTQLTFHSENGIVGLGKPVEGGTPDYHVIDAGGRAYDMQDGAACFDSILSFTLIRGGRLDLAVLGSFEVAANGDLANWMIPGKLTPGMGGGMEVAQKARHVMIVSRHMDKEGKPKFVKSCSLPLTAAGCVGTLVTERAVFRRQNGKMTLASIHPDHTSDSALEGLDFNVPALEKMEPWQ